MPEYSSNLNNTIRDVSPEFAKLVSESPSFLARVPNFGKNGQTVFHTKHEWIDIKMSPTRSAITSFGTDGDGTVINVASTDGLEAGSIITFTSSTGATKTEYAKVVSVNSTTQITISRDYASTTGVTLVVGDIVHLFSTPKIEKSSAGASRLKQGEMVYNYTQIFDKNLSVSRTLLQTKAYDRAQLLNFQLEARMLDLARDLETVIIRSAIRQQGDTDNNVPGIMGGLLFYLSQSGANIESSGGNISSTIINNAIEDIVADGGDGSNLVILCSENQARRISALNFSGTNPQNFKDVGDTKLYSGFTTAFVGDLPIGDKGAVAKIFSSFSMFKDKVMIVDMNKVSVEYMQPVFIEQLAKSTDGEDWRMLTELTLEVRNAKDAHSLITGLNI